MPQPIIYRLCCPSTGNVRYVGKTMENRKVHRFSDHVKSAERGENTHRSEWIRSLLKDGLKPVFKVIEIVPKGVNWQDRERFWISEYRKTCDLTNYMDGGEGGPVNLGRKLGPMSPANREKHAAAMAKRRGKPSPIPPEKMAQVLAKANAARRGKPNKWGHHDDAAKEKIGATHRGRKLTPEHREKLAAAKRGKKQSHEHIAKRMAKLKPRMGKKNHSSQLCLNLI